MAESNGSSRLDRIERLIEAIADEHIKLVERHSDFQQEHKQLLTAQVLLTGKMAELTDAQKQTDERLNALITIVDGIIRNRPQQ